MNKTKHLLGFNSNQYRLMGSNAFSKSTNGQENPTGYFIEKLLSFIATLIYSGLEQGQGHQNWFESVKLDGSYHPSELQRSG